MEQPATKTKDVTTPAGHTFIPGLEELGTSPTSAFLDSDFHQLFLSCTKPREENPHVEIFKHTDVGLMQACQIGNKLISMTYGNADLSLVIASYFYRGMARTGEDREDFYCRRV